MKKYRITYFISSYEDIEITIMAKDKDEAIAYGKNYRKESFFIEEVE